MSTEENKAIARRVTEVLFGKGNLDVADGIYAPAFLGHASGGEEIHGPAGMKQLANLYRTAFPDLHAAVVDQIAEGDKVMTRWTNAGKNTGEMMGNPPTKKQASFTGITIDRIAEGRIVESWFEYDALGMMQQLGIFPQPREGGN